MRRLGRTPRRVLLSAAALTALALSGCFSTAARLSFDQVGEQHVVANLSAGKVRFAAAVEAKYQGDAVGRYDVDLVQGNRVAAHATCDPLAMTGSRSCVYRFANQDTYCNFVMACTAHLDTGGPTTIRVRFSIPTKPADFKLRRAELIVGQ